MKILIILNVCQVVLGLASQSVTVSETPGNCTKVDKAALQRKVTAEMEKVIEQLFQDASFFRRKRFVTDENKPESSRSDIPPTPRPEEQSTIYLDTVVPQELEREHQRVEAENTPAKTKRAVHFQYVLSQENNAYANAQYKKKKNDNDSNVQVATAKGGDSAYSSASSRSLWRQKRFCVPLSYDDGVKKMVKKVVDETFKRIQI